MRYSDDYLDALRNEGDPVPDQIIRELALTNQIEAVNATLRTLTQNNQHVPESLPDNLEFWLRDTVRLPEQADTARLDRASAFFVEHGVTMSLLLSTASFVEGYAARKGVKALSFTYRLEQNPYRRVAETAQFLLLVLSPGGLYDHGQGVAAIEKVRLMHSAIRYLIAQSGRWPQAELGSPICQEDLLGTLMCLSYVVIENMRKLAIMVTDDEAEDYLYLWRIAGEMLGCRADALPQTMTEAQALTTAIRRRQHGPSPEGIAMTRALLEMHAELIPGELFDGLVPALMRYLVGQSVAEWLEIPRTRWDGLMDTGDAVARVLDAVDRKTGPLADVVDKLGMAFLSRQAIALAGYERAAFEIPTALQAAWHITT